MYNLSKTISEISAMRCSQTGKFTVPNDFLRPGFWAVLAAYATRNHLQADDILFANSTHREYASALGLSRSIWNNDTFTLQRTNAGINYSPLARIDCSAAVDSASTTINSCLLSLVGDARDSQATRDFANVIGELHDNVWSHGQTTGFSCAQKWKTGRNSTNNYIEFAVADAGLGLLREIQRVGRIPGILTDEDAIRWCIQEGNSTKLLESQEDDWAQSLPEDFSFNPLKGIKVKTKSNNHQGLGLSKLVSTVRNYGGSIELITGSAMLKIKENGAEHYSTIPNAWQGVAIACKFRDDKLLNLARSAPPTAEVAFIMDQLRS